VEFSDIQELDKFYVAAHEAAHAVVAAAYGTETEAYLQTVGAVPGLSLEDQADYRTVVGRIGFLDPIPESVDWAPVALAGVMGEELLSPNNGYDDLDDQDYGEREIVGDFVNYLELKILDPSPTDWSVSGLDPESLDTSQLEESVRIVVSILVRNRRFYQSCFDLLRTEGRLHLNEEKANSIQPGFWGCLLQRSVVSK
jgi:hypothetical protein